MCISNKTSELIKRLKSSTTFADSRALLSEIDLSTLSSRQYTLLSRKIVQFNDNPDLKIAYLSDFTIDTVVDYVTVAVSRIGMLCKSYIGLFNQYFQELAIPSTSLMQFNPDIILLALSPIGIFSEVVRNYSSLTNKEKEEHLENTIKHIASCIAFAENRFSANILVTNFSIPSSYAAGIADPNSAFSELEFYNSLNRRLVDLVRQYNRVHIFDIARLIAYIGIEKSFDPKMYYLAKMYWSECLLPKVADEITRFIIGLKGKTKKCLVLDLDNTIWGGVVGEEGPLGVKCGLGDPESEAYYDFQYRIKALKNRGIMLSICSKNNYNDVLEVFEKRSEMPLHIDDFVALEVNWDNKHQNIINIAKDLNVGLDSIVFIDDNPVECSLVRQMLPQVKTYQLPQNHEQIPCFINQLIDFEKVTILYDDLNKTEQYHQNRERKKLKESVHDLKSFLYSLETEVYIRLAKIDDLPRIYQLFTKTNQFNLTTIRYAMSNIEEFLNNNIYNLTIVSVKDVFGDIGVVGLYLLKFEDDHAYIDSFIMSCRVMGRGLEIAIMNHIKKLCMSNNLIKFVTASYIPTEKNKPVIMFLDEQGFKRVNQDNTGKKEYMLLKEEIKLKECPWIRANIEEK